MQSINPLAHADVADKKSTEMSGNSFDNQETKGEKTESKEIQCKETEPKEIECKMTGSKETENTENTEKANTSIWILPPEVRTVIWGHCLVVGSVYPYLDTHRQEMDNDCIHDDAYYYDTPHIPLLLTCKLIRKESEILLYERNTFVMPTASLTAKFFSTSLNTLTRQSWVKLVEIDLDPSDLAPADKAVIRGSQRRWHEQHQHQLRNQNAPSALDDQRIYAEDLHKAFKTYLVKVVWPGKLAPIMNHLVLDKLTVNLECSRCEDECCTLFAGALTAFMPGFALAVPKKFQTYAQFDLDEAGIFDVGDYPEYPERIMTTAVEKWSLDHGRCDQNSQPVSGSWNISRSDRWLEDAKLEINQVGMWGP